MAVDLDPGALHRIQDAIVFFDPGEKGNQLGGFILNDDLAFFEPVLSSGKELEQWMAKGLKEPLVTLGSAKMTEGSVFQGIDSGTQLTFLIHRCGYLIRRL